MKLSIVLGTLNRKEYLRKCADSIQASAARVSHEIVIVDGGSTDGTVEWLRMQSHLVVIEQGRRLGAVKAFCAGFRVARGDYVANGNDDAIYVGDTLARACAYLDSHPKCGQVAIPFGTPDENPHVDILPNWLAKTLGKKNLPYANFGVIRRELGEEFKWWDEEHFYQYGGDTYLSAAVWRAGWTVDRLDGGRIIHYAVEDDTRIVNIESEMLAAVFGVPKSVELMQARNRAQARDRARQERAAAIWRTPRTGARSAEPIPPIIDFAKIRYLGDHHSPAMFTDTTTGRKYLVRLSPGATFDIDARDAATFLAKRGERGEPLFEMVK